jgi:hypothetical protein
MFFVYFNCTSSCLEALICTGKIHLIQSGGSDVSKSLDELSSVLISNSFCMVIHIAYSIVLEFLIS